MSINNASMINQTSGEQEYYTPPHIVDAARKVLGGSISLDPATSIRANEIVGAERIFTRESDGLSREWFGTVWMNHPFGKTENPLWIQKFLEEYRSGRMQAGCCITFACTSERWFRPLLEFAQCFLSPRTNYLLPDGSVKKGVTKGSVVTYVGPDFERFACVFAAHGVPKFTWGFGTHER